ncbi:S10 family serine carboxypeptidase-like protein [Microbacterium sp. 179-I 3D4 NHS]|uniref:S10 family serine carboxypeptidase-like protein n=1 Tax=Microbacterium sp. 179-I 3D4 NHS TaxID=3142381 RepID=UPI0039A3933F
MTTRETVGRIGGLEYTARLEELPLRRSDGAAQGTLSAFSYTVDAPDRPILFLTNGGPGVSSIYLHLSGIGPWRARIPLDPAGHGAPPYGIEESRSTLLDVADLVFLDAPGTGFGSVVEDRDPGDFRSVEADADAIAAAIGDWVDRHGRWDARKFFLGESYGTIRAAFLATSAHLADTAPLDGLVLLGQAVNIQETFGRPGNIVGALANLPYKAATAWYHGAGSQEHPRVEDAIRAALDFARGDLALAMLQGDELAEPARTAVAQRLSKMIGLPVESLVASRLWTSQQDFRSDLLPGRVLGVTDSRYAAPAADRRLGELEYDPSDVALTPRYTTALSRLLQEVFAVASDQPYRVTDPDAGRDWEWDEAGVALFPTYGQPSPFRTYPYPARLSRWMKQNPRGRLFIGTGVYDSLTTVGAADHLLRHYDLPRERTESHWYRAGHMMYSDAGVGETLNDDLRAFLVR